MFKKKGILRNNKVADLRPATFLRKRLWRRCFRVNFAKFLRTPFYRIPQVAASEKGNNHMSQK